MQQKLTLRDFITTLFGNEFTNMPTEEVISVFKSKSDKLEKIWHNSNFTDFSIYRHPDYIYDMFTCYHYISRNSIINMQKFFKKIGADYKNFTYLDHYNGIGLTTLHLLNDIQSDNITFFNDNPEQISTFNKLCKSYNFDLPKNENDTESKYDVVISFECAEHYKEPIEYVKNLFNKTNKYLVYSSGFKEVYPGHFPDYIINITLSMVKLIV